MNKKTDFAIQVCLLALFVTIGIACSTSLIPMLVWPMVIPVPFVVRIVVGIGSLLLDAFFISSFVKLVQYLWLEYKR